MFLRKRKPIVLALDETTSITFEKGAVTKVTVTKKDKEGVDPIREGALLRGKI